MTSNNYPIITEADAYFRQNEKRLMHQERRPMVKTASDILGPGIAPYAVQIDHWDADEATFNGVFWTAPGDTGAPDLTHWWIGQTEASDDGFGMQQVLTFHDSLIFPPITQRRQFFDPGNGNITYSQWVSQHQIAVGDALTSQGNAGGAGAFSLNGDGTVSIPGLIPNPAPYVRRSRSTGQNFTQLTFETVENWDNVIEDDGSWTVPAGLGTFTLVGPPGKWLCTASVKLNAGDPDAPYVARMKWRRNGTNDIFFGPTLNWDAGSDTWVTISGVVTMPLAGQTLELQLLVNAAGAGTVQSTSGDDSLISFTWIGG
jgi:hypothetical protein